MYLSRRMGIGPTIAVLHVQNIQYIEEIVPEL